MKRDPVPQCPIRRGEPCTLCVPGATGPQDCGLVYLVMSDPELRDRLQQLGKRDRPVPAQQAWVTARRG
ncbi:MAG TPA: DUF6767 domain-containing protein [Jatrophihabitans sp.]|nr:DUF6767 domain-containing protein [Jatrophihabitans sp.]